MSFAEGTTVDVSKTRAEIESLARKHGASQFGSGWRQRRSRPVADARDDNTPRATITDADRASAKLVLFAGGPSVRRWIELGDGDFPERIAQAIADAREAAFALCVEWVRDAEGGGVAADLVVAWRSQ